jgi:hypothetical protein
VRSVLLLRLESLVALFLVQSLSSPPPPPSSPPL